MVDHRLIISGGISGGGTPQAVGGGAPTATTTPAVPQSPSLNIMANHLREIAAGTSGFPGAMKAIGKEMGIKVGIAGVLKQSQLFTGMIGSIFQILGAAVDIILAAFMPILVPAIRGLAGLLPRLHSAVDKYLGGIIDWIVKIGSYIMGDGIKEAVGSKVEGFFQVFLGEESALAKKLGEVSGSTAGTVAKLAMWALPIAALTGMGRFMRLGGGIGTLFRGLGTTTRAIFTGTKFGSAITTALGNSKVFQGLSRFFKGGKTATDVAKGAQAASKGSRWARFGTSALKLGKLSKAIPILGSVAMGVETAVNTVQNIKQARGTGKSWKQSLALGGATLASGAAGAVASFFAPGVGFAAYEAQQMGINAMMNKYGGQNRRLTEGTLTGMVVNVISQHDGQTKDQVQLNINENTSSTTVLSTYNDSAVGDQ